MTYEQLEAFYLRHGFRKQDGPHPYYEYKAELPKPIEPTIACRTQSEIISEINQEIEKNHGIHRYEHAILNYELPLYNRNEIAKQYIEEGWKYVYRRTTSKTNERPGFTAFYISIVPIDTLHNIYRVTKDEILHIDNSFQIDQRL